MPDSLRLYNCILCRRQVKICRVCDRGNIYCNGTCSKQTRQKSLREAGARYQRTHRGRLNHADRQRRYRACQKNKVTHQGSIKKANPSSFLGKLKAVCQSVKLTHGNVCDFCHCRKGDFLRFRFLRHYHRRVTGLPSGP